MLSRFDTSEFEPYGGNVIERFEPVEGRPQWVGGMAVCSEVKLDGRLLVLKCLRPEFRGMPQYEESLRKEFSVGFRLEHEGLPRYVYYGSDAEGSYLLMERIDGCQLDEYAAKPGALRSASERRQLLDQLLDTIGYLHSQGVLHLDLKPSNILVTRVGHRLKIIDLGCSSTDAMNGTPGGTAQFHAPEVPRDTEAADIYSIGRILQYLRETSGAYRSLRRVISRATAVDPGERYQSIDAMRSAINGVSRRRRLFLAASVAAVIAIAAGIFLTAEREAPAEAITDGSELSDASDAPDLTETTSEASDEPETVVKKESVETAEALREFDPEFERTFAAGTSVEEKRQTKALVDELVAKAPKLMEKYHEWYRHPVIEGDTAKCLMLRYGNDLRAFGEDFDVLKAELERKYPLIPSWDMTVMVRNAYNYIHSQFMREFDQSGALSKPYFANYCESWAKYDLRSAIRRWFPLQ